MTSHAYYMLVAGQLDTVGFPSPVCHDNSQKISIHGNQLFVVYGTQQIVTVG